MVLQLVLPQPNRDSSPGGRDSNYKTANSINSTNPVDFRLGLDSAQSTFTPSFLASFKSDSQELFSPTKFGYQSSRASDANLASTASVDGRSEGSSFNSNNPKPSSDAEKNRMFRGYLTRILSCVYAVFIVTLGVVIYIADLVSRESRMAAIFSIYLVSIGLLWFVFLYASIKKYLKVMKANDGSTLGRDDSSVKEDVQYRESPDGDIHLSIHLPWSAASHQPHSYCFSRGRHSGSFYLKIGAAGFCLGHLTHQGLLLSYQIIYFITSDEVYVECANVPVLILDILYPTYSFLQLFFIFKYSNVIINHCQELARFAFMHCIASSLCFWFWTILRETMESLNKHSKGNVDTIHVAGESLDSLIALPLTSYHERGAKDLLNAINKTSSTDGFCENSNQMSVVFSNFSPYLYPFTIEYSILVVGILFIIWQNIGSCERKDESKRDCHPLPLSYENGFTSNVVIHADCHSANKGLFAGMIVMVGSVVSIILFFITMANSAYINTGLMVNSVTELMLLLLMTLTVIFSYRQLTRLDVNKHPVSLLDDLLLFICIPAFFLYAIFSIVPAVEKVNYLSIVTILIQVIQVLLQTPFIIDGLRRCSNTHALRYEKPGRELVTFLVVCNVAMWITETFEIKSQDVHDDRYVFYGEVLWTMLSHVTLPLTMFYRFHSSVCLADIWKSAYERGQ